MWYLLCSQPISQSPIHIVVTMKFRPLKQHTENDCGPTSIRMIAAYFGLPNVSRELARLTHRAREDGLSNTDLVTALRSLRLTVRSRPNNSWGDLILNNTPDHAIVVSWMLNGYIGHFSLVDKVSKTSIFLADPNRGSVIRLPRFVFLRLWFDYDGLWYPKRPNDIQLRWMAVVSRTEAGRHRRRSFADRTSSP